MKTKVIKIYLRPDYEAGCYYADMVTDVSLTTVRNTFDSLSHHDGSIIEEKVSHTRAYKIKRKIKSFVKRTLYLFKAIFNGIKSGYEDDYKKQHFDDLEV